jgi:hypothetical protein
MSIEKPGQDEFEFPDEAEQVVDSHEEVDELDIEVEDDTPAADRGRQPLPKELVDELEKDELEEYSDKVKNRLKQMKKVWHDERREKERAMREQNEAMAFAKRMLEENKKLKTTLFEGEKTYLDTYKASTELELGVAKKQYKDALEEGDSDGIVEAQSKLNEVNYKIQKAREYVPSLQETDSSVYSEATPSRVVPEPDSKALAWKDKNTWFQRDEEMTALALGLEQRLVREYGPQFVGTDKYWDTIDETMHKRFPEYFGVEEKTTTGGGRPDSRTGTRSSNVVAPATRSTSSKRIKLNASQMALTKKLGITPQTYAKEFLKTSKENN